jgi:hypothetical protein
MEFGRMEFGLILFDLISSAGIVEEVGEGVKCLTETTVVGELALNAADAD